MKRYEIWVEIDKSSNDLFLRSACGSDNDLLIAVAPGSDFREACIAFLQKLFIDPIEYKHLSAAAFKKAHGNATKKALDEMSINDPRFEKRVTENLDGIYCKVRNGVMAHSFKKNLGKVVKYMLG